MLKLNWDEFCVYLFIDLKQSDSGNNVSAMKSRFNIILRWFEGKSFDRNNFNQFIYYLQQKNYKVNYINNFIKLGKHIDRYTNSNILQDYTYFKKPKYQFVDYLTPDEIRSLADVEIDYPFEPKYTNQKYRALIWFLGTTGCRINEALDLEWTDIISNRVIFRDTKNHEERMVPIRPKVQGLINNLPHRSKYVFNMRDDSSVNIDLKKRSAACHIEKRVYNHLFRHSFISQMLKQRVPETYIRRITGHKSADSMEPYAHALMEDLEYILDSHPLMHDEEDLPELCKRFKDFVDTYANPKKFKKVIEESEDYFVIKVLKSSVASLVVAGLFVFQ